MTSIASGLWVPSGNDYLIDGLWGRLGVQENFGETYVSGATNGLAVKETNDKVFLYAGAVNGGVHLRVYDKATDQWGDRWTWISKPGSGYIGSQSIGVLSISDDGEYLAVGQGNPSNSGPSGAPSEGVQVGAIQNDGSIQWLPVAEGAAEALDNQNIRSMEWVGANLVATSWDNLNGFNRSGSGGIIEITTTPQGITAARTEQIDSNLTLSKGADTVIYAGYDRNSPYISLYDQRQSSFIPLTGNIYEELQQMLAVQGKQVARVAVFPELINDSLVAFLGTFSSNPDYINGIIRLEINPETREVLGYQDLTIAEGDIGASQASNLEFYGNFSFAVDPFDETGNAVFVGGNQFGSATLQSPTYDGGLVRVDFSGVEPKISETLYGPKIDTVNDVVVTPFSPGQPHADSRSIAFYESATGTKLIQTDDGGIWELALQTTPFGSTASPDAWWQSLTTKGLSSLETNMVSWASQSNSIASSYQDNAASLGYYGDDYATNFWRGDGQLAFFDDATDDGTYAGYLSSQQYLGDGLLAKVLYDERGYISSRQNANFFLRRSSDQSAIPWQWTSESQYYLFNTTPFILPSEANAYQSNRIVFSGLLNIYETIEPSELAASNAIVLRPLLKSDFEPINGNLLNPTAIDNQGSADMANIGSLYIGALDPSGNPTIYGRSSNSDGDYTLEEIGLGENREQFIANGSVVDLAHSPQGNGDTMYWIQGGQSLSFGNYFTPALSAKDQVLGIQQSDGTLIFLKLAELGLPFDDNDRYGYQALVFVPGNSQRADRLVIGGLQGIWSAELDGDGLLSGAFQSMPWQGLPEGTAPGSYIKTIQYDPHDDLLIAGTKGQGSFIYSFTGDLGERLASTELIHVSDVDLNQKAAANLDKRGNQANSTIAIQLDGMLREPDVDIKIEIVLHDANAWREVMDYVSAYDIGVSEQRIADGSAKDTAIKFLNILDPQGLDYRGGREENGDIIMPFTFPSDVNLYNLVVNQKEFASPRDTIELAYSVRAIDDIDQASAVLRLVPDYASTRANFYGSSLAFDQDYFENLAVPGGDQVIQARIPASHSASSIFNAYTITPVVNTGLALLPVEDASYSIRSTLVIDSFDQLKLVDANDSPARSDAWMFALISNIDLQALLSEARATGQKEAVIQEYLSRFSRRASVSTYDPISGAGSRFYDLSENGYADRVDISANASQRQFTDNVNLAFASIVLNPSFQAVDSRQILLSGLDSSSASSEVPFSTVNFRLSANLDQRPSVTSSLGYVLFNPYENFQDFNFTLFRNRARTLISSLGASVDLNAMPAGFDFSSEILANNGQRLMFFEVEGASLDQLSGLDDPRLHWLDTSLAVDGKSVSLFTPNGAEATIAITPGFQGVDPLIADLQNQAPILDFTAFANDQIIELSLGYGREAAFDSVTGWYVIQSKDGAVVAADGNTLRPGHPNYINEAIRQDNRIDSLSGLFIEDGETRTLDAQVLGGVLLAPYAQVSGGDTYVAFAEANSDGLEHFMSLGTNLIGFEDLPNGGDRDFQDAVWSFDFAVDLMA
ncbi:DUF4114 domain-containing protein [Synechococcus sp. BMK-MC-1]|uniref:DUF4114 domain-containing protein n=1 Tax=Synechococcus sp. BMK-MC-1 TaxID=1442551 RepID=UPI0016493AE5|nr:DUF4114 domain-containing protein [Synechococcus sp. BMK-MC-1]QNI67148.1 hemolysin-type calcium-binding repeat family protein [Synechococcus sp. BMK-MC-1]